MAFSGTANINVQASVGITIQNFLTDEFPGLIINLSQPFAFHSFQTSNCSPGVGIDYGYFINFF